MGGARGRAACSRTAARRPATSATRSSGAHGTAAGGTTVLVATKRAPERLAVCLDTAHLHAAGYDVAGNVEAVWEEFDRVLGRSLLKCLHLNDSRARRGSRLDRHQWIGDGTIGPAAFRSIMRDPRLRKVIKIIETPKADDPVRHDRRMLRRLRAYARGSASRPLAVRMT